MKFAIYPGDVKGLWEIRDPTTLRHIATVEGFNMRDVTFSCRRMVGTVTAVFGCQFIDEAVAADIRVLRSLNINGNFDMREGEPITVEYDGAYPYGNTQVPPIRETKFVGAIFNTLWRRENVREVAGV